MSITAERLLFHNTVKSFNGCGHHLSGGAYKLVQLELVPICITLPFDCDQTENNQHQKGHENMMANKLLKHQMSK